MANVLTSAGEAWIVDMLDGGAVGTQYIGMGTGADTADKSDTTLSSESTEDRVAATRTQPSADIIRYVATIAADGTKTITNAGVLTLADAGTLILFSDFAGIPVLLGDSIKFTFNMEIT